MKISTSVIIQELMWEYDYTQQQAEEIVLTYKKHDKLPELFELIQHKASIARIKEELCSNV